MKNPLKLKQWFAFWRYVTLKFFQDDCTYRAAALAFTSLFALVPLLTLSLTVLTIFPDFQSLIKQIQDFIFTYFVAAVGQAIQQYLLQFVEQAARLSLLGIIFLGVTAILTLFTIEQTFNQIWQAKKHRNVFVGLLLYLVLLIVAPLLLGLSFVITSYVLAFAHTISVASTKILLTGMPFLLSSVAFTLLYKTLPNCRVNLWHALGGGLFAAILFEIIKRGFTLYLKFFPTYELLYGAVAVFPIFLMWIYVCWIIVLLGAEVSHALGTERRASYV